MREDAEDLLDGQVVQLEPGSNAPGVFEGGLTIEHSGLYAYGLRVRATGDLGDPGDVLRDLVRWIG